MTKERIFTLASQRRCGARAMRQDAKAELERHIWGTFVEGDMSVAPGGTGVVVSGC
jgi:hypothetical protein